LSPSQLQLSAFKDLCIIKAKPSKSGSFLSDLFTSRRVSFRVQSVGELAASVCHRQSHCCPLPAPLERNMNKSRNLISISQQSKRARNPWMWHLIASVDWSGFSPRSQVLSCPNLNTCSWLCPNISYTRQIRNIRYKKSSCRTVGRRLHAAVKHIASHTSNLPTSRSLGPEPCVIQGSVCHSFPPNGSTYLCSI